MRISMLWMVVVAATVASYGLLGISGSGSATLYDIVPIGWT